MNKRRNLDNQTMGGKKYRDIMFTDDSHRYRSDPPRQKAAPKEKRPEEPSRLEKQKSKFNERKARRKAKKAPAAKAPAAKAATGPATRKVDGMLARGLASVTRSASRKSAPAPAAKKESPKSAPVAYSKADAKKGVTPPTRVSPTAPTPKADAPKKKVSNKPVSTVKTKGGDYPVYKKDSGKAKNFRETFAAAKKAGKATFEWDGRKYTTEVK